MQEKYKIFDHSTISIHILAGKIQNCLAFGVDPKMLDLDALCNWALMSGPSKFSDDKS